MLEELKLVEFRGKLEWFTRSNGKTPFYVMLYTRTGRNLRSGLL